MAKKFKCVRTQPEAKKTGLKTCAILTSFRKTAIEEMNEDESKNYRRDH